MSEENLFNGISAHKIAELVQTTHHQVKKFSKGEVITSEGDTYNKLLIIVEGLVHTEMENSEGHILMLEQIKAPATLAPASIFASTPVIPVTIVAQKECKAVVFTLEALQELFSKEQKIMQNFIRIISNRALFLTNKVKMLQFQSLKAKLAQYILQEYKTQNTHQIKLSKTQQQLADILGVARPSISRKLQEMNTEGIIIAKGKHITIQNVEKLKECVR